MKTINNSILLIENHPENLENYMEIFELEGYQVLPSRNGEMGIGLARTQRPNLIISDVRLPDINGFDLLKHFKTNPSTQKIPFLFLSALSEKNMINKGLALGATDYLIKPCCIEKMLTRIREVVTTVN